MIKTWAFEFNIPLGPDIVDYTDEKVVQRAFDDTLEHVARCEDLGFEGVFFSEHHFISTLSPSPHLLIAASAPRTRNLKLGVMGSVLGFHEPWRMTEELGMLDYITEGRLEIGVASGVPSEFLFLDIPQSEVRPRFQEFLKYLDVAAKQPTVDFEGEYFNYKQLPVLPRLKDVGRRRKWMTVYSAGTCRLAAQLGYRVCTGAQSVENATKAFDAYREEADKIGYETTPDDFGIRRSVLLGETDEEAKELFERVNPVSLARLEASFVPVNERLKSVLGDNAMAPVLKSGVKDAAAPQRSPEESHLPDHSKAETPKFEDVADFNDEFIIGSPTTVAEKIIDQCRRMGGSQFLGMHQMALTKDEFNQHYSYWEKVNEILRKADV
ncbi:LLM class flavin-dependent oxidoreductase [Streptomyces sp. NPDC090106]|uniref:LLM class flavin-dependent oxidoreductase n=1 Tax=Streptomyces sp. NPDC090106 TaxID=3365946 RepID=UPI0038003B07